MITIFYSCYYFIVVVAVVDGWSRSKKRTRCQNIMSTVCVSSPRFNDSNHDTPLVDVHVISAVTTTLKDPTKIIGRTVELSTTPSSPKLTSSSLSSLSSKIKGNIVSKDREVSNLRQQIESLSEDLKFTAKTKDALIRENRKLQEESENMSKDAHVIWLE